MATFFAPQPTYKAPTFQELAAPLLLYREAYNDMEQKYDAQREKNAMLQAMLGSDPDNEISQYMVDYNALMDETARGFSNGTLPYAQLYGNYRKLRDIWNDKGVKMTAAIDSFTKYKDARSKMPGAIGPEYTLWDFHKNPNLSYSFFSPEDIYKAGALSGAAYAQQKGPRNGRPAPNGQWIDEYGPTNDEVATAFTDSNNPFYNDANSIMQQYGIDPNSDNAAIFRNAYQRGLASSQKLVPSHNVDYITKYQRIQMAKQEKAEKKQERLEMLLGAEGKKYRRPALGKDGKQIKFAGLDVWWIPEVKQYGYYPKDENGVESDYFTPVPQTQIYQTESNKEEEGVGYKLTPDTGVDTNDIP